MNISDLIALQEKMNNEERQALAHDSLKWAFEYIQHFDNEKQYTERNMMVMVSIPMAINAGVPVGIRIDPKEPEWPVVFFELPTGQVSWHLPQHINAWDGHSTGEKYERVRKFIESSAEDENNT